MPDGLVLSPIASHIKSAALFAACLLQCLREPIVDRSTEADLLCLLANGSRITTQLRRHVHYGLISILPIPRNAIFQQGLEQYDLMLLPFSTSLRGFLLTQLSGLLIT